MTDHDKEFGLSRIGQIAVIVHDLERAVAFYRDVLGMTFLFAVPNMAFFDCDGVRLMLGLPSGEDLDPQASIVYYKVEDIHVAHQVLASRGVELEAGPLVAHRAEDHDLWLAFFRDPDGNLLALMSEAPRQ